jgi:orotidine-5'-phosphate decarboxylase
VLNAERGAKAMFEAWDFDATTVNVYQGADAIRPFLGYMDRGVFVVCRTSNVSSRDFQDRSSGHPAIGLFGVVADAAEATLPAVGTWTPVARCLAMVRYTTRSCPR